MYEFRWRSYAPVTIGTLVPFRCTQVISRCSQFYCPCVALPEARIASRRLATTIGGTLGQVTWGMYSVAGLIVASLSAGYLAGRATTRPTRKSQHTTDDDREVKLDIAEDSKLVIHYKFSYLVKLKGPRSLSSELISECL